MAHSTKKPAVASSIIISHPHRRFRRVLPCGKDTTAELVVVICVNGARQFRLMCCSKHGLDQENISHSKLARAEMTNARVHHSNAAEGVQPLPLRRQPRCTPEQPPLFEPWEK
jgi:hypothetical protein